MIVPSVSRGAPAVRLPNLDPVGDSFDQVLGVGSDDNTTPALVTPLAALQCDNGCPYVGTVTLLRMKQACWSFTLEAQSYVPMFAWV